MKKILSLPQFKKEPLAAVKTLFKRLPKEKLPEFSKKLTGMGFTGPAKTRELIRRMQKEAAPPRAVKKAPERGNRNSFER